MYLPAARSASKLSRADSSSATLAGVPIRQPFVGQALVALAVAVGPSAPQTTIGNRTTHTIAIVRDSMYLITFPSAAPLEYMDRGSAFVAVTRYNTTRSRVSRHRGCGGL